MVSCWPLLYFMGCFGINNFFFLLSFIAISWFHIKKNFNDQEKRKFHHHSGSVAYTLHKLELNLLHQKCRFHTLKYKELSVPAEIHISTLLNLSLTLLMLFVVCGARKLKTQQATKLSETLKRCERPRWEMWRVRREGKRIYILNVIAKHWYVLFDVFHYYWKFYKLLVKWRKKSARRAILAELRGEINRFW